MVGISTNILNFLFFLIEYFSPEEHAYFPDQLPTPILPLINRYLYYLKPNSINYNQRIKTLYETTILPLICEEGDDKNYGSAATCDIHVLQVLSKRVHYGKYVAEVKFQKEREKFESAIQNQDSELLMQYITNSEVEKKLLQRIYLKASRYGQDIDPITGEILESNYKVNPQVIVDLYEKFLIPITKDIEVDYLLQRLNSSVDVAFLGPIGTFSHAAASKYFSLVKETSFKPTDTIPNIIEAVISNKVTYGIIPYRNSFAGFVPATNELLHNTTAHICGEVSISIALHLVGKSGTNLRNVKRVYSHPHALAQARDWIKENLDPNAKTSETSSTAEGAKLVSELEDHECAALASKHAAELYGLEILALNAQDSPHSETRFLVVAKQYSKSSTGSDGTLLRFTLLNNAGTLSSALAIFAKYSINLRHIESRPVLKNTAEGAQFLIECDGHAMHSSILSALEDLRKLTVDVRVIGTFAHA